MTNKELLKSHLSVAKSKHLLFISRVSTYLLNPDSVEEKLLSDSSACDLGKWILRAKTTFGETSNLESLDDIHERIHTAARTLIANRKIDNEQQVQKTLIEIKKIASEILAAIGEIEKEIEAA